MAAPHRRPQAQLLRASGAISDLVTKRKLDDATLVEIEDVLVRADLGLDAAGRIAARLRKARHDAAITPDEVKAVVAAEVEKMLMPVAQPLAIDPLKKPFVILVVGVNGSGKTTTIGKLAAQNARRRPHASCWPPATRFAPPRSSSSKSGSERTGAAFVARDAGADAAGLAFDAVAEAKQQGTDVS